jgi:hypothetical protein
MTRLAFLTPLLACLAGCHGITTQALPCPEPDMSCDLYPENPPEAEPAGPQPGGSITIRIINRTPRQASYSVEGGGTAAPFYRYVYTPAWESVTLQDVVTVPQGTSVPLSIKAYPQGSPPRTVYFSTTSEALPQGCIGVLEEGPEYPEVSASCSAG